MNLGEPGVADGLVRQVICFAGDVWDAVPVRAVIDPDELVDQTLDRLATTIGRPTGDNGVRERLAYVFRSWAEGTEVPDGS